MSALPYVFAAVVLVAIALSGITVWSPRRLWVKGVSVGLAGALMVRAYVGFSELLSKPKPVGLEWGMRSVADARLLGASAREGEAIFVWLQIQGVAEPRSYRLPWNRDMAEQLESASREARANRTSVRVRRPFGTVTRDREEEPTFYAAPRAPRPVKPAASQGIVVLDPRQRG